MLAYWELSCWHQPKLRCLLAGELAVIWSGLKLGFLLRWSQQRGRPTMHYWTYCQESANYNQQDDQQGCTAQLIGFVESTMALHITLYQYVERIGQLELPVV